MNLAINVYEYGREGKCVYMFRHTHAGIREMKINLKKEIRHMSRVMLASIGTVTEVSIKFVEKEKENKKAVRDVEQNTKHRGTQRAQHR